MLSLHGRNDRDMKRYLEEHRLHVATQIQKLKILKVRKKYILLYVQILIFLF